MNKTILISANVLGLLGICLGAFAAHGLEALVSEESIKSFETGVKYQIYMAFFLLIIGGTSLVEPKWKKSIFYLALIGTLCFSGSIYGLATNELSAFDFKKIALITPLGGLLMIGAWIVLLFGLIKGSRNLPK
ncbi:MAG: DUF423 domain-containing protein [Bacteroidota bacterium]